jgi:hypothetical protein
VKIGAPSFLRRSISPALAGVLVAVLAACTGRGGGQLAADSPEFTGPATFGFSFSCERSSNSTNLNPPTGRLHLRLSYADHGSNPLGSRFSIHAVPDPIDPILESQICIAQNPPPGETELILMGRFRLTGPAPAGFPTSCPTRETPTTPLCRFEVIVRDNDQGSAGSAADFFSIRLSTSTEGQYTEFPAETVFYARAGLVEGGNITIG